MRTSLRLAAGIAALSLSITAAQAQLTGRIRDFNDTHPDFEKAIANDLGIVKSTLGADKKPVYANPGGITPTTSGKANFDQWYRDTPGVNLGKDFQIDFTDLGGGYCGFTNNAFFPIDNQLLGNQGRGHNYHFTLELHGQFEYQAGQTFDLAGDDDIWVFINGQLVIDLGGVHPTQGTSLDLDGLGLTAGNDYDFSLFFAERHTVASTLEIRTNIKLTPTSVVPEASTTATTLLFAGAIGGLLLARRRRTPSALTRSC